MDGWASHAHAKERVQFLRSLQSIAQEKGVRVSILAGDAHICGIARMYTRPKMRDLRQDHRFMTQVRKLAQQGWGGGGW